MSRPMVSVLMPAFNVERYIESSINSVLSQTFKDFELIVLDDGSTDATASIISAYDDPRIKKIFLPKNKGLVNARNTLVELAKGEFVAFLDADDIADSKRLDVQIEYMQSNRLDLCGADHLVLFQKTGKLKRSKQRHSDADIRAMISVNSPLCNPSVMGRADIFKKMPYTPDNDYAEDYVMWVNLALEGMKFGNVPKTLITYRVHDTQISQVENRALNNIFFKNRERYINALGIDSDLIPREMPWQERLKKGTRFLFLLNKKIPGISIAANYQIYARFQFRGNGVLTPITRTERFLVALVATFCSDNLAH